jgi:NADPH:quinone reductase-like Zn-dependent oxidoreductase
MFSVGLILLQIPLGFSLQEAVTLPNNVVTVFHAVTTDFSLPLPWPCPPIPSPPHANSPILIWGGASSCGQYALQILSHWGYKNLLTTASPSHHEYLLSIGAAHVFDYHDPDVSKHIIKVGQKQTPVIPFIFDCIGSRLGSLAQAAQISQRGTKVAVLTPVVLKDATEDEPPEYSMDTQPHAQWAEGVEVRGVRTHFYMEVSCIPWSLEAIEH